MIHAQSNKEVVVLTPTSGTSTVSSQLDLKNADYATIRVVCNANTVTTSTVSLAIGESDTTATFTTSQTSSMGSSFQTTEAVGAHQTVFHVDTRSRKRYLNLKLTPSTVTTDTRIIAVHASLSRLAVRPASTTDQVGSTNDVVVIG